MPTIPSPERQMQRAIYDFKASLVHTEFKTSQRYIMKFCH